ncbi:MAG: hypothetical protein ACRD0N_08190, partial [Acidimicrobiales bacterium]
MIRRAARLAAAVAVSAPVALLVRAALPDRLDVRTDIVGYPIHRNFDVYGLFRNYYVATLLFPVLTLAVYAGLARWGSWPRSVRGRPRPPVDDPPAEPPGWHAPKAAAGRLVFTGVVVGLAVALIVEPSRLFWLLAGAVAAGYAAMVAAAGAGLRA